jgi:hypothetical protein
VTAYPFSAAAPWMPPRKASASGNFLSRLDAYYCMATIRDFFFLMSKFEH